VGAVLVAVEELAHTTAPGQTGRSRSFADGLLMNAAASVTVVLDVTDVASPWDAGGQPAPG
jgi:hypothetical protein